MTAVLVTRLESKEDVHGPAVSAAREAELNLTTVLPDHNLTESAEKTSQEEERRPDVGTAAKGRPSIDQLFISYNENLKSINKTL